MLTPNQIKAADLLSQGASHQEVADAVGVSRRTILRWLNQADFKNWSYALINHSSAPQPPPQQMPSKVKADAPLKPCDLIQDALQAVQSILTDPDTRVGDRLKAASLAAEWSGLKARGTYAELEAVNVLVASGFVTQSILDVIIDGGEEYVQKVKNAFHQPPDSAKLSIEREVISNYDDDDDDDD